LEHPEGDLLQVWLKPGIRKNAVRYRYYVENAAAHPALIGTHWFQWIDQPSTGRNDGENYNIGFLVLLTGHIQNWLMLQGNF